MMMKMRNLFLGALLIIGGGSKGLLASSLEQGTYFHYSAQDLSPLSNLKGFGEMNPLDLLTWDKKIFDLIRKARPGGAETAEYLAYLMVAQRDAAILTLRLRGSFQGSLLPTTRSVACLFFPKGCRVFGDKTRDDFSEKLADLVVMKIKYRMREDEKGRRGYPLKRGVDSWWGQEPFIGREVGSWQPWFLKSPGQYRAPQPPLPGSKMNQQLAAVRASLAQITGPQKKAVLYWAMGRGSETPAGYWLGVADDALEVSKASLEQALRVRFILSTSIADTNIAVFDSKYTYWTKRPFMLDPTLKTILPTPNHPSYPAGHGAVAGVASTVLAHFFPDQKDRWLQLASECRNSRLWGGIHFPTDNEQGFRLGAKVANWTIRQAH